jgi:hypothetical protein
MPILLSSDLRRTAVDKMLCLLLPTSHSLAADGCATFRRPSNSNAAACAEDCARILEQRRMRASGLSSSWWSGSFGGAGERVLSSSLLLFKASFTFART